MPIVTLKYNFEIPEDKKHNFLNAFVAVVSTTMNKPENDVQVLYSFTDIWMMNSDAPSAFFDIRFVSGLTKEIAETLSSQLAAILQTIVDIDLARININFFDIPGEHAWRFKNGKAVCPPSKNTVSK